MITNFSLDTFRITNTRSLINDTDYVSVSITVGNKATITQTRAMGDVNNGTHQVGLRVSAEIPADNTPVVFSYAIVNNGHSDHATVQKELEAALTTLGNAGVKAASSAAGAAIGAALGSLIGTAAVPLIGTGLGALSGWLVGEIGSLLFANCDGPVAAGVRIFTGAQLIQNTAGGQKLTETVEHHGTDSAAGCGANSVYVTTDTIATAATIKTVIDLNGQWAAGGVPGPVIAVNGNSIAIDMSASHRPSATGSIVDSFDITVNFPDDKTYTAKLQQPGTIKWSNNSTWTKVAAIQTVIDLNGQWAAGGVPGPVIAVNGNSIAIDMSASHRPSATGLIVDSSDITVKFPDDKTYTAKLQQPGTIKWSNNSTWTKVARAVGTANSSAPAVTA